MVNSNHCYTNWQKKIIQSLSVMVHCIRTDAKKHLFTFFSFIFIQGSFVCFVYRYSYIFDNSSWRQELSLNTNYYCNTSILQICVLFFSYQLLLILMVPTRGRGSCALTPAFRLRTKIWEEFIDGKTVLTVCEKPSLCTINISPYFYMLFSLFRNYKSQCAISHQFCKDILDVSSRVSQAGTRTSAGDPWLCKFPKIQAWTTSKYATGI